jgi:hypothetical protein
VLLHLQGYFAGGSLPEEVGTTVPPHSAILGGAPLQVSAGQSNLHTGTVYTKRSAEISLQKATQGCKIYLFLNLKNYFCMLGQKMQLLANISQKNRHD